MVANNTTSIKDCIFHDAVAMAVDLCKLGSVPGKKYKQPLDARACVCSFEKAIYAGQLQNIVDPVHPLRDLIEQLSTCYLSITECSLCSSSTSSYCH